MNEHFSKSLNFQFCNIMHTSVNSSIGGGAKVCESIYKSNLNLSTNNVFEDAAVRRRATQRYYSFADSRRGKFHIPRASIYVVFFFELRAAWIMSNVECRMSNVDCGQKTP